MYSDVAQLAQDPTFGKIKGQSGSSGVTSDFYTLIYLVAFPYLPSAHSHLSHQTPRTRPGPACLSFPAVQAGILKYSGQV